MFADNTGIFRDIKGLGYRKVLRDKPDNYRIVEVRPPAAGLLPTQTPVPLLLSTGSKVSSTSFHSALSLLLLGGAKRRGEGPVAPLPLQHLSHSDRGRPQPPCDEGQLCAHQISRSPTINTHRPMVLPCTGSVFPAAPQHLMASMLAAVKPRMAWRITQPHLCCRASCEVVEHSCRHGPE